jgi:hypothetical protein
VHGKDGQLEVTDPKGQWKELLEEHTDGKAWGKLLEEQPRGKQHVKLFGKLKGAHGEDATAKLHEHLLELHESGELDVDVEQLHSHLMKLHHMKPQQGEQGSKLEQLRDKLSKLMHGEGHSKESGKGFKSGVKRFDFGDGTSGEIHVEVIVGDDDSRFEELELPRMKTGGKVKVLLRGDGESDVQVLELDELKGGRLLSTEGGKARYLELDASGGEHGQLFFRKSSGAENGDGDGDAPRNHYFFRTESDDHEGGNHFFFRQGSDEGDGAKVQRRVLRLNGVTGEALQLQSSPGSYQLRVPTDLKLELKTDCEVDTECDVDVDLDCEKTLQAKPAAGQIV